MSAAEAYAWWDADPATGPDPGVLIAALETGDVELLGDAMFNDLQAGVVSRHPEVAAAIDGFLEAGPSAPSSAGAVPRSPRSPGTSGMPRPSRPPWRGRSW